MLLPLLLYLPVGLCFTVGLFDEFRPTKDINWQGFVWVAPFFLTVWLAPAAVGSFLSISFRNQMLTVALTAAGTLGIIILMFLIAFTFGYSPMWTTVPICIALLVASRIRAYYWIRETFTWRSRLIPLIPVFGVILAMFIA